MDGTKWGDAPLNTFQIAKIAEAESGELYNYYLFIHALGYKIVMREKIDNTEYKYAELTVVWADRATLTYVDYDKLA